MDTASSAGVGLEQVVRRELTDAGFTVERSLSPADGGLGVWHDPTRGVIVTWSHPAEQLMKHATVRTAVRLALWTVLVRAGHQVREEANGLELIIMS